MFDLQIEGFETITGALELPEEPEPDEIVLPKGELWRVRNDFERADMQYKCRTLLEGWPNPNMKQAPQVVPLFLTPARSSGGNRTPIERYKSFVRTINDIRDREDRKWRYYIRPNSGWFNVQGWDRWEALTMGDNLVSVLEWRRGFARIETLYLEDSVPDPKIVNYELTPWLIHRFTVITPANNVIDPPPGRIVTPIIVKRLVNRVPGEYWIPGEWLIEV